MKKTLLALVIVTVGLALSMKAFAEEAKANKVENKPAVSATAKPATPAATTTAVESSLLKGNVTAVDAISMKIKDNAGKEWTFKTGSVNAKDYKVGDNVEVKYEKENLKSIARAK